MKEIGTALAWTIWGSLVVCLLFIFGLKACQWDYAYNTKMAELGYIQQPIDTTKTELSHSNIWVKPN